MEEKKYFHALTFDLDKCNGCTKCIKICPTNALRIKDGKVEFYESRCIDCGKCIKACLFDAILPYYDNLFNIKKFKYKVAIVSSSFPGQFEDSIGYKKSKKVLKKIGFDLVLEESMVTGLAKKFIRSYIKDHKNIRPIISSDCPTIVRLIQVRFPILLPNLVHLESPMSFLSIYYREKLSQEKKLDKKDIGIFLIAPCISQVTSVHQPEGTYRSAFDGAISIGEIYCQVMQFHKDIKNVEDVEIYKNGLAWALSGKQATEIESKKIKTLAVSGIDNVIQVLSKIESHQMEYFDYVVLSNCTNGCVGGVLNVENPFVASSRIKRLIKETKPKYFFDDKLLQMYKNNQFDVLPLKPRSIMKLDSDISVALTKMKMIDDLIEKLPGYDCGACGSPTCKVFAEDIVEGKVKIEDCPILFKRKYENEKVK